MSMEEILTARITADVSEAIAGFRQVDSEVKRLRVSTMDLVRGFSGLLTSSYSLYRAYDMVARVQSDANATQQEITKAYLHAAAIAIPGVISAIDSAIRLYTSLKLALGTATLAQWLYNNALAVTHALSGPLGWAILATAAAVTAAAVAWMAASRRQADYNTALAQTVEQTREFISLEEELSRMSPLERLQREYTVVKRYYEAVSERMEYGRAGGSVNVSIGRVEVSTASLGSSLDRDRAAEDLAKKIGRKIALRGISGA